MALGKIIMKSLIKNVINENFIIHHKLDKELKINNSIINNHIIRYNKENNPFVIDWEINIARIFQLQMELFDADYNRFTSLLSLNGIVLKQNKLYQKETYVNLNNLQDTPDLSMIYHVSGSDNLKIRFTHSYGRVMNKEYDYDLKVGDLVMFSSNINHTIFNSREENTLLLVHYQHQNP